MTEIVQKDNKILREIAKEVSLKEITTPKIQQILKKMKEALDSQDDGVALAAPQIGESLRIFIVSPKAFEIESKKLRDLENLVFINPKILKLSKKKISTPEGCLSIRWWYGQVKRANRATIQAHNEKGELFERGAGGLLAQIFQHETDHLDGVLFTDKAEELEEIIPEKKDE
jgi:peptide deformylase